MAQVVFFNTGIAGHVANYDLPNPLSFLTQGGIYKPATDPNMLIGDDSTALNTIVTCVQTSQVVSNLEVSLYGVHNNAATDATIEAALWEFTLGVDGNLGMYTAPTSPLATISLTGPPGHSLVIYGSAALEATISQGSGLAVSLQVTDVPSTSGTMFSARYLGLVSGPSAPTGATGTDGAGGPTGEIGGIGQTGPTGSNGQDGATGATGSSLGTAVTYSGVLQAADLIPGGTAYASLGFGGTALISATAIPGAGGCCVWRASRSGTLSSLRLFVTTPTVVSDGDVDYNAVVYSATPIEGDTTTAPIFAASGIACGITLAGPQTSTTHYSGFSDLSDTLSVLAGDLICLMLSITAPDTPSTSPISISAGLLLT